MLSFITDWTQRKELEKDLESIKVLSPEARSLVCKFVVGTMLELESEFNMPLTKIMHSKSYNPIEDGNWSEIVMFINLKLRIPAMQNARRGIPGSDVSQLALGVIVHSLRAIIDFELHGKRDKMLYCKTMWHHLTGGVKEKIPSRFA